MTTLQLQFDSQPPADAAAVPLCDQSSSTCQSAGTWPAEGQARQGGSRGGRQCGRAESQPAAAAAHASAASWQAQAQGECYTSDARLCSAIREAGSGEGCAWQGPLPLSVLSELAVGAAGLGLGLGPPIGACVRCEPPVGAVADLGRGEVWLMHWDRQGEHD